MRVRSGMRKGEVGFTIVELLIALVVLNLVLAIGFSFYYFGSRAFAVGEVRSILQRDLRLVGDFITRETRNATHIELLGEEDNYDIQVLTDFEHIYWAGDAISHVSTITETVKTEVEITDVSFSLSPVTSADGGKSFLLSFRITGALQDQQYELESDVLLNNIKMANPETVTDKTIIKYAKPE